MAASLRSSSKHRTGSPSFVRCGRVSCSVYFDKAVLSHCFLRFRLGLLEPFPMYVAFPRSEYYCSSDFSGPFHQPRVVDLDVGTPYPFRRGVLSRSRLLTHLSSLHMPGSWTPPGLNSLALTANSDVDFHVIKRVVLTGIHIFRGSIASRHLRHSGLCNSLHTLRKGPSPDLPQCWLRHEIAPFFVCGTSIY